jgi:Protein of unknown function (DUF1566)
VTRTKRVACSALLVMLLQHAHATCVNGENTSIPPSTPTSSFSVLGDSTVLAPRTKLMWMRCLVGQTLSGGVCTGTPSSFTWADALNVAKGQTVAGHNDWRLPNVKELFSILEDRCYTPALNADLFPISELFTAWSSTPSAVNLANAFIEAWAVDGNGFVSRISPVTPLAVLLVRDAP